MTVQQFHKKDNQSVLELPTQLESLKENNKEEYERVMSFYESEEWQKVERAHLNSDRRYYEGRKAMSLSEHSELVSSKKEILWRTSFSKASREQTYQAHRRQV